jgi:hypothetical protein
MRRSAKRLATAPGAIVLAVLVSWSVAATAEDLQSYAATCQKETGIDVEGFDCLSGFEVPMDGVAGKDCAKPPYLPSADCRAGSRLGVQLSADDPNVAVVWLCRKKGDQSGLGQELFQDIAAIKTNFANGATCFYQSLGNKLDGRNVPPPRDGTFWFTPERTTQEACASCHDTGLLRTPYLTQVVYPDGDRQGQQVLPRKRHRKNYWFPGEAFLAWNGKVKKIVDTRADKNCTRCHPMGQNTLDKDFGTSTWLGLLATGDENTPHLTPDSSGGRKAFWMSPAAEKDGHPRVEDQVDARRMAACASGYGDNCTLEDWGGQLEAAREGLKNKPLPALMRPIVQSSQE